MQLALDMAPRSQRQRRAERPTIEQRFKAFDAANPQVYATLVRLAREAKAAGATRLGAKALWERCRWDLQVMTTGADGFRLDNSLVALYARRLMDKEPDLAGLFEIRQRRSR